MSFDWSNPEGYIIERQRRGKMDKIGGDRIFKEKWSG
jgi:hypothetical protein